MISLLQADQELLASVSLREFLSLELSYRKNRSELYSIRALARDLEVPVSSLSIVLKGRSRFTEATIHKVAGNLKRPEVVAEYFRQMALAEIEAPGDHSIQAREIRLRYLHAPEVLPHRIVDGWDLVNLALPLLLQRESPSSDDSLCERLGLHWKTLEAMKGELESIGWLQRRAGVLSSRIRLLELRAHAHAYQIRALRQKAFQQAIRDLDQLPEEEQNFHNSFFTMDPARASEVAEKIRQAILAICEEEGPAQPGHEVYTIGTFLLPLSGRKR